MKNFIFSISKAALATLISTGVFASLPLSSTAQVNDVIKSGPELNEISQATTLLIVGIYDERPVGNGSGSLIAKNGDSCIGVTNRHVIEDPSGNFTFVVRTADNEIHPVTEIRAFSQEDLALVTFECQQDYTPIPLATYQLSPGQNVYLSGWPADSGPSNTFIRHFTSGSISTILDVPVEGYQIGYTNVTNSGMSGGQVLDEAGRLVAIHGLGALENSSVIAHRLGVDESTAQALADKTGFNYGIPITTFLARAAQAGFNYPYTVVYSSPQSPASGSVAATGDYTYQPDESDQVRTDDVLSNADRLFETINNGANTFCRFLGC